MVKLSKMAANDISVTTYPRIALAGDSAIVIELGSEIDPGVNDQVYSLLKTVETEDLEAVRELVPTYRSLLVNYDPLVSRFLEMNERLSELVDLSLCQANHEPEQHCIVELPVVYGGDDGPDLESLAEHVNLSVKDVIEIHSSIDYRVYMIGFAPGFPYLGGLDQRIAMPRLKTPRVSVPAGSVGIAESQTGVYPNASPGGWQLIGRTLAQLFDVNNPSPSLITPGSKVRFVPVKSHDQ
jgi:KipI family sensor histidine kinase inhibitor